MATRDEWREQQAAEIALVDWAEQNARRDDLVRQAIRLGVSRRRVHVLTGIARTTIDRIIDPLGIAAEADAEVERQIIGDVSNWKPEGLGPIVGPGAATFIGVMTAPAPGYTEIANEGGIRWHARTDRPDGA